MGGPYILGVDVGTTALKSALFTLDGSLVAEASMEYGILHPMPSWVEQDPKVWWIALKEALRLILKKIDAKDVSALGICCLCPSVIPVDAHGRPLRNAIIWMDRRSEEQAEGLRREPGEGEFASIACNRVAPGAFSATSILWLKEKERASYEKTWKFLHANGFLGLRLTGRASMDWTNASFTLLFDVRKRAWSERLCEATKIELAKLPEALAPWECLGEVTAQASEETGLPKGIPVAAGAADSASAALGVGCVEAGDAMDSTGASTVLGVCVSKPSFHPKVPIRCHSIPDMWLYIAPCNATGASLRWFRDNFAEAERLEAQRLSISPYSLLDLEASKAEPGSKGLVFLPYLAGERAPIWSPKVKGLLYGLSLEHGRADIIRAILEGCAYALRHNIETLEASGISIASLIATGGGARSALWRQIKADITGKPILLTGVKEAAAFGSAILASTVAGFYGDPRKASKDMVKILDKSMPNPALREMYSRLFELYRRISETLVLSLS
ncbi:MAG: FGGY-family carbohydrate kinase [Candidatus Bathyarchaeia archaeon]